MAIQFVGSTSGTNTSNGTITLSLTSLSGGISSTAATDDLVVIIHGAGSISDLNLSMSTSGYTEIADVYGNSTYDANLAVAYKKMGATPDTSAVVNATGINSGNAAIAYVWRGVNTTTPIDVTTTTANGTNNYLPNAPSITPTTSGAVIIAAGAGASSSTYTTPSGMSNGVSVAASATYTIAIGAASYAWSSGAYDPAAWTGGSAYILATMDGWAAASVALRPDSGLSVSVNDAVAITESNTLVVVTNPNISVFDTVAISEFSEYFRENRTVSVSDTISISESKTAAKNEFPILFHDTFTGTDGTLITAHAPEIGTGWTQIITIGDGGLILDVNTLYCEGSGNDGGLATAEIGYTYPSADYEVECIDVGSSSASDEPVTIAVRVQDANNMYTLEWTQGFFGIYKRVSGTWTRLNTGTVYPAPGDTVTLRIDGSSIKGFINGTERVSTTDTSITAAGEAGAGIGAVRLTNDDVGDGDISELKVRLISFPCSPIDSLSVLESVLVEVTTGSTALTVSVFESVQILENITTSGVVNSFVYDAPSVTENISIVRLTPISTLQDDFDDNSIDSTKWTTWANNGTTAETNSRIELTVTPNTSSAEASLISANTYSLLGSSMTVNISQLASPGVDTAVFLQSDYGDRVMWLLNASGNAAHAVYDIDYSWVQDNSITLAAGANTCVRIREDGGTVYWDYSTDGGSSWTNAQTRAVSNIIFSLNSLTAFLNIWEYSATGATTEDTSILDNFNVSITTRTVSVFDAVSISENVQAAGLVTASVFDAVAIAENIQTAGLVTVSVFDARTINENIQTAGSSTVSVFDAVAIAENIQTAGLVTVSVFDTRTINENIQTAGSATISIFDAVEIAENIQTAGFVTISVFDATAVTENIQTSGVFAVSIFDTVAIAENIQTAGLVTVLVFDTRTINENIQTAGLTTASVFDAVAIAENIQTSGVFSASIFDAVAIAENIQTAGLVTVSVFDTVAVAENTQIIISVTGSVFDQVAISESVTAFASSAAGVSALVYDQVTILEEVAIDVPCFTSVFDSISCVDVVTPAATIGVTVADQVGIAQNIVVVTQPLHIFVYETIAVVDVPSLFIVSDGTIAAVDVVSIQEGVVLLIPVLYVSVFDTRTIGEDIQTLVLASISVADVVTIVENVQTSSVFSFSVFDAVAIAENVQTAGLVTVSVFDARTIGEDVPTTISTVISVFDTRTIGEDVQTAGSATISVFDTRTISEDVQTVSSAIISVFDTGTIAENVQTAGSATISVFDTMAIGEDVQIVGSAGISVFDQVAVNESSTAVTHMAVLVFGGVAITEGVGASLPTSVSTSDVIAIAETVQLQAGSQINVFDGIGMQEDVSTWAIALVSVQDIIAIQEFAGGFVSCSINVSDLIAVEDAPLVGAGSSVISIVDAISIEDVASVGAIQVDLFAYDDILLLEDVATADVRFISVYDQITIIAILAAFPDTVHISESVTVLVEDSGVTIGTLVFDGILLEDAVSIFSVFPIVVWDNVEVAAVLAAFPDTVHITESVFVFVEDIGVSIGVMAIDQVSLDDWVIDISISIILYEIYNLILVEDVVKIFPEKLFINVYDFCAVYDIDPSTTGVTEYVNVFSDVAVSDFFDAFVPFYCVIADDLVTIFPIAGAKSALTIQGVDTVTVSPYINVTSIYELVVFDTITVGELYPDVSFNLITYFVYDPISVRERAVVYTRDAAFANLTPPEYRGRGTHGVGQGKKFGGVGEVVMAGSATRTIEQRWGAPGVGTRDRYTGTAIST